MTNSRILWLNQDDPPDAFPPVSGALREPDGLLAAGGDLSSERLLAAYRRGIFPWYDDGQPLLWWSPDPRCVFLPGDLHISKRLRRALRRSAAEIRFNTAFAEVIRACARPRRYGPGTWITRDMIEAYENLHAAGWAHSLEVWQDDRLVGGLYGLVIGSAMFGESMFSEMPNASKFCLVLLDRLLSDGRLGIVDGQVESGHLLTLGARPITRADFVQHLDRLCEPETPFKSWPDGPIKVPELLAK
ncbi:MAG: leucyl/phenylalanyl-tRNA--protein transferase [Woeseiaceae bacterium]|nr:leucyl/phenylalanyl-tRNA--protein transferase [Woeseiaceae bacterium]